MIYVNYITIKILYFIDQIFKWYNTQKYKEVYPYLFITQVFYKDNYIKQFLTGIFRDILSS